MGPHLTALTNRVNIVTFTEMVPCSKEGKRQNIPGVIRSVTYMVVIWPVWWKRWFVTPNLFILSSSPSSINIIIFNGWDGNERDVYVWIKTFLNALSIKTQILSWHGLKWLHFQEGPVYIRNYFSQEWLSWNRKHCSFKESSLGIMFCALLLLSASSQLFYDYLGKGRFFLRTLKQNSDVNSIMHLSKNSKEWHVTIFLLHLKS